MVIIVNQKRLGQRIHKKEVRIFKRKGIKYFIYVAINRIKGNEVSILDDKYL